jgi:hypothetical protein
MEVIDATIQDHELASIFPLLSDGELATLAQDIELNGLIDDLVLLEGKILDGRNRYRACIKAGVAPRFKDFDPSFGSALDYVVARNFHRRHLTTSQRASIATDLKELYVALGEEDKTLMVEPDTNDLSENTDSGNNDSEMNQNSNPPKILKKKRGRPAKGGRSIEKAAKSMRVSVGLVHHAAAIKAENPTIFDQVKRGELSIGAAEQKLHPKKRNTKPRLPVAQTSPTENKQTSPSPLLRFPKKPEAPEQFELWVTKYEREGSDHIHEWPLNYSIESLVDSLRFLLGIAEAHALNVPKEK